MKAAATGIKVCAATQRVPDQLEDADDEAEPCGQRHVGPGRLEDETDPYGEHHVPGQRGQGPIFRGSGDHLDHLTASFGRIDLGAGRLFQDVEESRRLIESEYAPELRRWLQGGGLTRIEGNHHESRENGEPGSGRPVGRGHRLEVVLDFVHGFPRRGQGAAQIEEKLL